MTIELRLERLEDLHNGGRDYDVYAGKLVVGRIYEHMRFGKDEWFWGLNRVSIGSEIGEFYGTGVGFDGAKTALRNAFDRWLIWAEQGDDPRRARARKQIAQIG